MPADAVVVGIGVVPSTALAETLGLVVENGVVVDGQMLASDGTTLAVGDDHVTVPGERRGVESLAVLVRPENLSLELPGYVPVSSSENALPVTVKTATYLGVGWRYDVVLFDGTSGIVRTPNDATRFGPGDQAVVTWDVRHGVLLEDLGEGDESTT